MSAGRRIRVAHLMPDLSLGGLEQWVLTLCRTRDNAGFDAVVAAPFDSMMGDEIRGTGVSVYTGPERFPAVARWADVIQIHWCAYDPWLQQVAERAGKPYVNTIHWLNELPALPGITICPSYYVKEIQPHPEQCVVIPNGVDLAEFSPARFPTRRPDDERIVLVRVCRSPKCAPYFWEGMARVLHRYPQVELWIVGNPDGVGRSTDRVHFLGLRRNVAEILSRSDLFVYTPFPDVGCNDLVVMEASAMGVPCVLSDVPAVRESIVEGENGFLTPFEDTDAFVEKVGLLMEDSKLRQRMSRAATQLAVRVFDARVAARRYESVYRMVLPTRGS